MASNDFHTQTQGAEELLIFWPWLLIAVKFYSWYHAKSATQPFLVSSPNAPPHWRGALRDDTKNSWVADYTG